MKIKNSYILLTFLLAVACNQSRFDTRELSMISQNGIVFGKYQYSDDNWTQIGNDINGFSRTMALKLNLQAVAEILK